MAEGRREADQDHDNGDGFDGAMHENRQLVPLVIAVIEHGDEEGPDAGDRGRLGGGVPARENAAENNDDGKQARQGVEHNL